MGGWSARAQGRGAGGRVRGRCGPLAFLVRRGDICGSKHSRSVPSMVKWASEKLTDLQHACLGIHAPLGR